MTNSDLRLLCISSGIPFDKIRLGAAAYAQPTAPWLDDFYPWFRGRLGSDDLGAWSVVWSCRQFTQSYCALAAEAWAKTPGIPSDLTSLAIGHFWFTPDPFRGMPPNSGHAIAVCAVAGALLFIDPQNNSPWTPSPAELASCSLCLFI